MIDFARLFSLDGRVALAIDGKFTPPLG